MSLLSGTVGGAKLGWFMMLNISTRNCTLKFSEIRLMLLFLKTEKSKLVMPGPIKMLRPALPRRLKHCRLGGVAVRSPPCQLFAVKNAASGAVGMAKHSVLIYLFRFPGFVRVLHPGPPSLFGNAQSSLF